MAAKRRVREEELIALARASAAGQDLAGALVRERVRASSRK